MVTQNGAGFPPGFVWGAATAAYQIEGATHEDGRGESIWDRFCRMPGKVRNGDTGDIACDHYHRYRQDVALMRDLGLRAYRFSIAWPRILPSGRGAINCRGLDFYDHLVDELLAAGIEPFATLYHWDLPQSLEDQGGWPNREIAGVFTEYTQAVVRRLGDRVRYWITHNEPWVIAWLGYGWGQHAPGRQSEADALAAGHHVLLSHGRAVEVIRAEAPEARVGITLDLYPVYPASDAEADREAAEIVDGMRNRWFLDPIFRGCYPARALERFAANMPVIAPGDLEIIRRPIDFLGINNYSRMVIRADPLTGLPLNVRPDGSRFTEMDWEVYPDGLHDILLRITREYAPKEIHVTENGAAFSDVRAHDGGIPDLERQQYLHEYLQACARAIQAGVPLAGYFAWSLLDNFEWGHGYGKRFGLVYVDYPSLERVPKGSAHWYRSYIEEHSTVPSY